jgi:hypothetical protein
MGRVFLLSGVSWAFEIEVLCLLWLVELQVYVSAAAREAQNEGVDDTADFASNSAANN